jgi:amino acid transporter
MIHRQPNRIPQRNRASLIVLITLAFLLMIGAGILVSQLPEDEAWQQETTVTSAPSPNDSGFATTAVEAQQMFPFSDGVMKVTSARVAFSGYPRC